MRTQDAFIVSDTEAVVPGLYLVEAGEVGRKGYLRGGLSREKAEALVDAITGLGLTVIRDEQLIPRARELAFDVSKTAQSRRPPAPQLRIYDALYVALAERLNTELWTCDRRLYDAVHGGAPTEIARLVKLLGTDPFVLA